MAKVTNGAVVVNGGAGVDDGVLADMGVAVDDGIGHDDGARGNGDARADLSRGMNDGGEGVVLGLEVLGDLSPNCVVADSDDPLAVFGVQVGQQAIAIKDGNALDMGLS